MAKQDFVLTELEALGKDIEALVLQERKLLEENERIKNERKKPGLPAMVRPYTPTKFMPEIEYFQHRLGAVRTYLAGETIARMNI